MRASSMILPAFVTSLLLTTCPPALAQQAAPPVSDNVRLSLSVEDWVKAQTARVILVIDSAGQAGGLSRADLLKAADAVADRTDWRVIAMDKVSDSAGLDRWRAMVETRLPEGRLAQLAERAKQASKPGQQIHVADVRFEPTLQEMEAARSALRVKLYGRIKEEVALLQQAFPDRHYRVSDLRFSEESGGYRDHLPPPPPSMAIQVATSARPETTRPAPPAAPPAPPRDGGGQSGGGGQEDKLILQAVVSLGAFAIP
ncbi:hypothetical protein [Niveispirillum sp. KHB5.9]|uniref:hypothetical protein n=1 Tax=Niveispirillum sp. KHB5.9 TaxID=3400269 RepID=UPI003A85044B